MLRHQPLPGLRSNTQPPHAKQKRIKMPTMLLRPPLQLSVAYLSHGMCWFLPFCVCGDAATVQCSTVIWDTAAISRGVLGKPVIESEQLVDRGRHICCLLYVRDHAANYILGIERSYLTLRRPILSSWYPALHCFRNPSTPPSVFSSEESLILPLVASLLTLHLIHDKSLALIGVLQPQLLLRTGTVLHVRIEASTNSCPHPARTPANPG